MSQFKKSLTTKDLTTNRLNFTGVYKYEVFGPGGMHYEIGDDDTTAAMAKAAVVYSVNNEVGIHKALSIIEGIRTCNK